MKPLDADEVDYNGGVCGLGHRVMKSTMKKRHVLVVNVWGSGNIIEVALVSFKFQPSSALHPYRLAADTSRYEHCCPVGLE
jgi:hypothetical protein